MGVVTPPRRLVVLAPNWLGDAVMVLPLIADIQRAWPDTNLTVAARSGVASLFAMVPGVADTIRLQGSGVRAPAAWRQNVRLLAAGRFDAALLLPNSFLAAWLVWRAGIAERWGFARDLRGRLLTKPIRRPSPTAHQAEYYRALAPALGIAVGGRAAGIVPDADAFVAARRLLEQSGIVNGQPYIVCAPGAAFGRAKQWLPERFAELCHLLAQEHLRVVLVGSGADAAVCREIVRHARRPHTETARFVGRTEASSHPIVDLSGQTDLGALAAVLSLSAGAVANDSGAMHLAAAVGTRLVAIFGPTDARKTSPVSLQGAPVPVIVTANVWCSPCMLRECPIDHRCMRRISARTVLEALGRG